jgi:hypothetical protein
VIGIWSEYSSTFLIWFALLIVLVFAIPYIFAPLSWGKVVGFTLPEDADLAIYFGRSLGVAVSGISLICYLASNTPAAQPVVFSGLIFISATLTATHIHGAIKKIQPLVETLEIGAWFGIMILQLAVFPN